MNKNLNLVDILKDCPKGTKLYSTIHGEVEFVEIRNYITDYPIIYKYKDKDGNYICSDNTTVDGKHAFCSDGECVLFPSKDQRDWSKFNIEPKFYISTFQPFNKVLARNWNEGKWTCDFFSHIGNDCFKFICIGNAYKQCIPYNYETKHLVDTNEMPPKKYITWEE